MDHARLGRYELAQLPTPLQFADRLTRQWGGPRIWIKRDDLTGFGLSGNKVRKLEYHLEAAKTTGANTLITCGAVQSNHCRATALVAAQVGLDCVLFLRSTDGNPPEEITGNHLLQRLAGAEVRFINQTQWDHRWELMTEAAAEISDAGGSAHVIPEGASDTLGVAAFRLATLELLDQLPPAMKPGPVTIWHASSSGGTTAGMALGLGEARHQSPSRIAGFEVNIVGSSVGETHSELTAKVDTLLAESQTTAPPAPYEITDHYVGQGYGQATEAELTVQVEATRLTGMIWDPTYTGKALYGLHQEITQGRFGPDDDVVFWHTGGGFAVFAHPFGAALGP